MKLSVSGKSLELIRQYHPQMFRKLLRQGVVFARMSPDQKQLIIENLQKIGLYVAMCGDGANDCGVKIIKQYYYYFIFFTCEYFINGVFVFLL